MKWPFLKVKEILYAIKLCAQKWKYIQMVTVLSIRAAIRSWVAYKHQKFISHSSGGWNSGFRVLE